MTKSIQHFGVMLVWMCLPMLATSAQVENRDIKSALIYNFAVYTTWPAQESNVLNVCAFQEDQDNINYHLLEEKKINDKKITYKTIDGIEEIKNCQVLYLEETHWIKDKRLKENIEKYSVLTIADTGNQSAYASMINLQLENKKYSFTINNQVAKEASLTLSSKLLRLATRVY
ncbi:MAG TPA: hypothetical protein DCO68_10080 [Methylophilaceae bacterium]|nr:hypothetical protein [Methylophilaceae bacterium]HAJ72413.1 hypothetical protein [Methylophilaceae bacterium]